MRLLSRIVAKDSRRALVGTSVFGALIVLIGFGLLLSNTYGASQVAENARLLHWTNATKGTAAIARAAVSQAVFFSFEELSGAGSKRAAIDEAMADLAAVRDRMGDGRSTQEIDDALASYLEAAEETISMAGSGEPSTADSFREAAVEPAYAELANLLEERQGALTELIEDSDEISGQISRITFVAIAFMIPATTMLVFWLVLRRRMRLREAEMAAEVESERELNRAKDELIAGLSHELRTPLTTIFGFSEILYEDESIQGEPHELLGLINASSSDLNRMVNDLLTAARLNAEALTTRLGGVDLAEEVGAVTEPYLRSGESLSIQVPAFHVYSDALHVRQIVHNLVSNALRHGGEEIAISATRTRGKVKLVVADNGPGVPDSMRDQLFKRFANRGRNAVVAGSVGLGLAISHELANNIGGSLRYNRVDGWTTFTLTLPVLLTKEDIWEAPQSETMTIGAGS